MNKSPRTKCWRLIHDGEKVIKLYEDEGILHTKSQLFCSEIKAECEAEIARLNLAPKEEV